MAEKYIEICDGWRLRRFDSRNWALQQWREPSKPSGARKVSDTSPRWFDTGDYYQTLGHALAAVFERCARDGGPEVEGLADAMARAEAIRTELMAVARD